MAKPRIFLPKGLKTALQTVPRFLVLAFLARGVLVWRQQDYDASVFLFGVLVLVAATTLIEICARWIPWALERFVGVQWVDKLARERTVNRIAVSTGRHPDELLEMLRAKGIRPHWNEPLDEEIAHQLARELGSEEEFIRAQTAIGDNRDRSVKPILPMPHNPPTEVTVKALAESTGVPPRTIIEMLIRRGTLATINQPLEPEVIEEICDEIESLRGQAGTQSGEQPET